MMFLIEYDRPSGRLLRFMPFENSERRKAEDLRLEIELDLHRRGITYEVVILEADSGATVRRTHRRYFETLEELSKPAKGTAE